MSSWMKKLLLRTNLVFTSRYESTTEKYAVCMEYQLKWSGIMGLKTLIGVTNWPIIFYAMGTCTIFMFSYFSMFVQPQKFLYYLRCTFIFPLGVQVYVKTISIVMKSKSVKALNDYIMKIHADNENNPIKCKDLNRVIDLLAVLFKFFHYSYVLSCIVFMIQPLIAKFLFNKPLEPILPICLPFVDIDTVSGYFINVLFHTSCAVLTCYAVFAFDTQISIFCLHYYALHLIIVRDLEEIESEMRKQSSQGKLRSMMINIFKLHYDMIQ